MTIIDVLIPIAMFGIQNGEYKIIIPLLIISQMSFNIFDYNIFIHGYYMASTVLIFINGEYKIFLALILHMILGQLSYNYDINNIVGSCHEQSRKIIMFQFMYAITIQNNDMVAFSLFTSIIMLIIQLIVM